MKCLHWSGRHHGEYCQESVRAQPTLSACRWLVTFYVFSHVWRLVCMRCEVCPVSPSVSVFLSSPGYLRTSLRDPGLSILWSHPSKQVRTSGTLYSKCDVQNGYEWHQLRLDPHSKQWHNMSLTDVRWYYRVAQWRRVPTIWIEEKTKCIWLDKLLWWQTKVDLLFLATHCLAILMAT